MVKHDGRCYFAGMVLGLAYSGCFYDWSVPKRIDGGLGSFEGGLESLSLDGFSPGESQKDANVTDDDASWSAHQEEPAADAGPETGRDSGTAVTDDAGPNVDATLVVESDGATVEAGGPDAAAPISIAGTGTSCRSYSAQSAGKCAGIYCGVSLSQIAAALPQPRVGRCTNVAPSYVCDGRINRAVGRCWRSTKTASALATSAELRPRTEACVFADTNAAIDVSVVSPSCLGCYLDSSDCLADFCLVECLGGDSPDCDACGRVNECFASESACTGLPDPR